MLHVNAIWVKRVEDDRWHLNNFEAGIYAVSLRNVKPTRRYPNVNISQLLLCKGIFIFWGCQMGQPLHRNGGSWEYILKGRSNSASLAVTGYKYLPRHTAS